MCEDQLQSEQSLNLDTQAACIKMALRTSPGGLRA